MRGGNKTIGKRNLSASENELVEYFTELENDQPDDDPQLSTSGQARVALSNGEEIRRLSAYVAHLKHTVSDLTVSHGEASAPRNRSQYSAAVIGLTVAVGLAAVFCITARR
jgi:hypothetical protein